MRRPGDTLYMILVPKKAERYFKDQRTNKVEGVYNFFTGRSNNKNGVGKLKIEKICRTPSNLTGYERIRDQRYKIRKKWGPMFLTRRSPGNQPKAQAESKDRHNQDSEPIQITPHPELWGEDKKRTMFYQAEKKNRLRSHKDHTDLSACWDRQKGPRPLQKDILLLPHRKRSPRPTPTITDVKYPVGCFRQQMRHGPTQGVRIRQQPINPGKRSRVGEIIAKRSKRTGSGLRIRKKTLPPKATIS